MQGGKESDELRMMSDEGKGKDRFAGGINLSFFHPALRSVL